MRDSWLQLTETHGTLKESQRAEDRNVLACGRTTLIVDCDEDQDEGKQSKSRDRAASRDLGLFALTSLGSELSTH